jgi:hypothetical protein
MYENIRISDADREHVTSRLREHFAEGRLTQDELDERITATLNAKTFGDLRGIMADLPEPAPVGSESFGPGPFGPGAFGPEAGPVQPGWTPRPMYYRRGPRILPLVLLVFFAALILPSVGWVAFAFLKIALLAWLVMCIAGIFAAARFRRRVRQSGNASPWSRGGWRR